MAGAQFQIYTRGAGRAAGAGGGAGGGAGDIRWRLISANHRDLGRSVSIYDDVLAAVHAIDGLVAGLARVERSLTCSHDDGLWRWAVRLDDADVAGASRGYRRRIECELSVKQFLALAAASTVNPQLRTFDATARTRGGSRRITPPATLHVAS